MSGADIAKEVSEALAEVARDVGDGEFLVTILRPAAQPQNPWDAPAGAPTEIELRAMVETFTQEQVDGTLIKAGDRNVFLDATDIVPTTSDRIVLPEGEFAILSVMPFAPAGVAIYHQLHCRR
jgi:hypothetical protein